MKFVKLMDILNNKLLSILGILFLIMTLVVSINILDRFFHLGLPIKWAEEVARYCMVWSVFLGGAIASRKDNLITVDALISFLPNKFGRFLKLSSSIITIVFFIYLISIGYHLSINTGLRETSPIMGIPMIGVYISILIGSVLTVMNIVSLLLETTLTNKDIRFISIENEVEEIEEQKNKTNF